MSALFDPGLQPERTTLAWRRTTLALGVGALVYARVASATVGGWAWALAAVGVAAAIMVAIGAARRHRSTYRSLTSGDSALPDGVLPAALAFAVTVGGLIVLALSLAN